MSYEEILERIQKAKALADSKKRKFGRGEKIEPPAKVETQERR